MKFGGTSVADIKKIKNVASIIKDKSKKYKIVAVLSAMAGATNNLQKNIDAISKTRSPDSDLVITSAEQVSVGLLSMILNKDNIKCMSMLGWQVPIITDNSYGKSKILNIDTKILKKNFKKFNVIVIAGFQGISLEGKISSLGRGGSDTSAVAIAAALKAERCDIFTDVAGVYTTDPNIYYRAKKINKISYEEMLEMASMGAKVLQSRSVELAMKNNLQLQVLSSFTKKTGTMIINEDKLIEKEIVSGVSYSKNESKITISGVPDKPGISAKIFGVLSDNNINVDMIVQNISQDGVKANLTFTVQSNDVDSAMSILKKNSSLINYQTLSNDNNVAKISVIGVGMISQTGVAKKMFETLAKNKINILAISTSEIKISVLINKRFIKEAVKSLHKVYNLN